ncbi:YbaK/EbsC family protein [Simkania sp.]|uniref:YbaK/EbsC family protein n=1 Tax=Simkania sp. TaxID=34094 RepID=UPI003B52CC52
MSETLSKSAASVQAVLEEKGIESKVVEMPASTRTAQEAADAIGCEVAQIVKSLIFRIQGTEEPVLILTSGVNRVNEKKIKHHLGQKIEKADANFTRGVTGFAIGGIPPIGHLQVIRTLIDQDLLQHEVCWAAAGTPHAVFSLKSSELVTLTDGEVVQVS